jgi:hypothetical protein
MPGCRGRWKIKGKRVAIFARKALAPAARLLAARQLRFRLNGPAVVQGTAPPKAETTSPLKAESTSSPPKTETDA